ncbi:MAG TPA: phosphodiester glycosidase family protein [Solirubrobacteraceae bacterium]|nr:phosphodiester glycosidase family protein [Solirubrobacteraceae bacterium]
MSVYRSNSAPARLVVTSTDPVVRARRIAWTASLVLVLVGLISWGGNIAGTSNTSLSISSVEWMRSNGLKGLVNTVENFYYSITAPSTGGPGIKSLPKLAGQALSPTQRQANRAIAAAQAAQAYRPPDIVPVIKPALPGEGVWRATYPVPKGTPPPVLITDFRPSALYPRVVGGVAWINHLDTNVMLYPGVQEPSVTMPNRGPEEVPTSIRGNLVATFNSAFKLTDSEGGFVYGGHTYAPMHNGLSAVVRYTNGTVNVIQWEYGPTAPSNIVFARQNLPLLVDNGRLNPTISDEALWGATLGNAVLVWRSALGIDRYGNLIYAASDYQTVTSLAKLMQRAGAVRAMQLDINSYWPSFITYAHPGASDPSNLLPDMQRSPYRYLTPDDRDFFAVTLKK